MALDVLEESSEFFGGRLFLDGRVLGAALRRSQEWPGVKLNSSITDMIGGLLWRCCRAAEAAVRAVGDFAD